MAVTGAQKGRSTLFSSGEVEFQVCLPDGLEGVVSIGWARAMFRVARTTGSDEKSGRAGVKREAEEDWGRGGWK